MDTCPPGTLHGTSRPAPAVRWERPEWLADHLGDPGLILLDARPDCHAYIAGHLPGSLWLHEARVRGHTGRIPAHWIGPEAAEILIASLGINANQPVVVYAGGGPAGTPGNNGDGLEQYLIAYTLARFGCRDVIILDGGYSRWVAEKRPVAREYGSARLSAFRAAMQVEYFISREECALLKDGSDTVLLDTRPEVAYAGEEGGDRAGHIPGAVSLPVSLLLDAGNHAQIRPVQEIRQVLEARGVTPEKTVICSSTTGRSAAAVFLILKFYLGYPDVVIFEGGFMEWSAYPEDPVVAGKERR